MGMALSVWITLAAVGKAMADAEGMGGRLVKVFLASAGAAAISSVGQFGLSVARHLEPSRGELPFAGCNSAGTVFAAAILLALGCWGSSRVSERIALAALIPFLVAALIATQSRGAFVALGVGLVVLGLRSRRRLVMGLVVLAVFLAVFARIYPSIGARYASVLSPVANRSRLEIWRTAVLMIRDHPVLGVGVNNFANAWANYPHSDPLGVAQPFAHNVFLELGAAAGVPGLLGFLVVAVLAIRAGVRALRSVGTGQSAAVALAVFVAILVHLQFDLTVYSGNMLPLFFAVYAVLIRLEETAASASRRRPDLVPDAGGEAGEAGEAGEVGTRACEEGRQGRPFVSVIVPTYNRRQILEKCLSALLEQTYPAASYELIVIDDGSTDDTRAMVGRMSREREAGAGSSPIVYRYRQHTSISAARNEGIRIARGELVIFLDSDIVTKPDFIAAHVRVHQEAVLAARRGGGRLDSDEAAGVESDRAIVHGRVIYTTNLDEPTSEKRKLTDVSAAFFATTNVSIARRWLIEAGLFDEDFTEYGWEDLELGKRLKKLGLRAVRSEEPVGYHFKHEFSVSNLPAIRRKEIERGHMAVLYYRKHPTLSVRMTTMLVPPFFWLVALLTPGGWPDRPGAAGLLDKLHRGGRRAAVAALLQIMVYYWYAKGMREGLTPAPQCPRTCR